MRIVYIANARLPTQKAHGFQIVKMCEAYAGLGADVELLHPYRFQHDEDLRDRTVFDYYGVEPSFSVKVLPNLDVLRLERFLPRILFGPLYYAHAIWWARTAAAAARGRPADLYHTRSEHIAFWLTRMGLPTVYEVHTVPRRLGRRLMTGVAARDSTRLVAVLTSFIKTRLIELGFPEERIEVLPDGVDLNMFEGTPEKDDCRRRLGLPLDRPIVGYVGRFHTMGMEKGIGDLIAAMSRTRPVNGKPPLLLCVGGPLDAVSGYLAEASRLGVPESNLRFVDRVPNSEVPIWLRACDVLTIPWPWSEFSAYFTSPLKLFEYMAAGVPIVASDLPSLREILHHGDNGWLVEPDNPGALSEGLNHVLADPGSARDMAGRALRDVQQHSWRDRAGRILEACGWSSAS